MSERLTKQPMLVYAMSIVELNDVLRRIQVELDRLAGLHGPVVVYDSLQYSDDNQQILHGFGVKP